mmetsp:Transcript_14482/g.31447  ORF Transcript_14482/g.31447 Transcript_14482/m.31447 type:complete len:349 (-) Transcript_14482:334-1380(-)
MNLLSLRIKSAQEDTQLARVGVQHTTILHENLRGGSKSLCESCAEDGHVFCPKPTAKRLVQLHQLGENQLCGPILCVELGVERKQEHGDAEGDELGVGTPWRGLPLLTPSACELEQCGHARPRKRRVRELAAGDERGEKLREEGDVGWADKDNMDIGSERRVNELEIAAMQLQKVSRLIASHCVSKLHPLSIGHLETPPGPVEEEGVDQGDGLGAEFAHELIDKIGQLEQPFEVRGSEKLREARSEEGDDGFAKTVDHRVEDKENFGVEMVRQNKRNAADNLENFKEQQRLVASDACKPLGETGDTLDIARDKGDDGGRFSRREGGPRRLDSLNGSLKRRRQTRQYTG